MESLFDLLKAEMRSRRWNVSRLAEACGADVALTSRWVAESPERRVIPSPRSCEKIAAALGVEADYVLELAGHRKPREARSEVSARRQAVRNELDRWLDAVGPDYEDAFWQKLKNEAESTVALISQLRTAVNAQGEAAVNAAVSKRAKRGRKTATNADGPLSISQHQVRPTLSTHSTAAVGAKAA